MMKTAIRRVAIGLLFFGAVVFMGALLLWFHGNGEYTLFETFYFALYTVTTVGFAELPNMEHRTRVVTALLMIFGVGAIAFFQSTVTTFLIEGVIGKAFRSRRMERKISALSGHIVIAGCGRTGRYIVEELAAIRRRFVVIDNNQARLLKLYDEYNSKLLYVVGDATDDHTLMAAGVQRALGVVASLPDDRDNLFVTLSSRTINPKARIVSKVVDADNEKKILRAGADSTVSPHRIGGLRLVSELVRPRVTEFLDQMLRVTKNLRFEEVEVPEGSIYAGRTLRKIPIRSETNLLVVALHREGEHYTYNPGPDAIVQAGTGLIVMGDVEGVEKLRALFGARDEGALRSETAEPID